MQSEGVGMSLSAMMQLIICAVRSCNIACEGVVWQWANVLVTRRACAVNEGRHVIIIVVFNNCRSVAVGADVVGIVFDGRRSLVNFLGAQIMMGLSMSTKGVSTGGVGRMLGAGGGSGATFPSRRVQKDWMASISSEGVFWMPTIVAVSLSVVLIILLVAVISGTGMA